MHFFRISARYEQCASRGNSELGGFKGLHVCRSLYCALAVGRCNLTRQVSQSFPFIFQFSTNFLAPLEEDVRLLS